MVRIIIERFIAESLEGYYEDVAQETLQKALRSQGFISGESLTDTQNSLHRFILCNWKSLEDWKHWEQSFERREMMGKLNLMLEKEERFTILEIS